MNKDVRKTALNKKEQRKIGLIKTSGITRTSGVDENPLAGFWTRQWLFCSHEPKQRLIGFLAWVYWMCFGDFVLKIHIFSLFDTLTILRVKISGKLHCKVFTAVFQG